MKTNFHKTVRNGNIFLLFALFATILSSCDQQQKEQSRKKLEDLKSYVQQHKDSVDRYVDAGWVSLNNDFEVKKAEVEKDTAKFDDNMRRDYYTVTSDWESFKSSYTTRKAEHNKLAQLDDLRKSVTMDGVRTDYADLTATNVVAEYQFFVNTVSANKDLYTKEQWTVINVTWKGLKGRTREIQKDISGADSAKILKLQLEYTAIKALNRPEADN